MVAGAGSPSQMRVSRERVLLLVLLVAAAAVWWLAWGEVSQDLTITVLDVGQGDCILVQAPGGRTALVDGGGQPGQGASGYDVGGEVVVPALMTRGVSKIDVLVITHPHDDHIGGLPAVLEAVPVGMVLDPMLKCDTAAYEALARSIKERGIPVHRAMEGQTINLGRGIRVAVLGPPDPPLSGIESELNDNSVVLRLVYDGVSMLLAGDVDEAGAARLAGLGEAVHSTILKAPHHGAAASAVPEFIAAVGPELAVISVGADNGFGHPTGEMLHELDRAGAKVMRTDRDGALTLKVRPRRWWATASSGRGRVAGEAEPVGARG